MGTGSVEKAATKSLTHGKPGKIETRAAGIEVGWRAWTGKAPAAGADGARCGSGLVAVGLAAAGPDEGVD
ncbi:MAG: hypothetical protein ACRD50_17100, partial [Candidatus Acidiferrales bacterium]